MLGRLLLLLGSLVALSLGGCGTIDYAALAPATLQGSLFVMWVGEGTASGDGKFLFVPDPQDPLIFKRHDPHAPGAVIQPGLMYTDGGSVPKIAQVFNGLSPWGYAPAYMVHDWMFVAHHCIVDGDPSQRYAQVRDVSFDDSAAILGEAIGGLVRAQRVRSDDLAATSITSAVDSAVARTLWDATGACAASAVSAKDVAAAEAAVPGSTQRGARRSFRAAPGSPGTLPSPAPARIITRMTF